MVGLYFNFAEELLLLNIQPRHAHTDTLSPILHCMWPLLNNVIDVLCAYRELECATRLARAWHYGNLG